MEPIMEPRRPYTNHEQGSVSLHDPMIYRYISSEEENFHFNMEEEGCRTYIPGRTPRVTSLPSQNSSILYPYRTGFIDFL